MKNFRLLFLSALAGLLAVSCTEEALNETWHPDQGLVTVITDWGESKDAYWTMPYTIKYGVEGSAMVDHTAYGLVEQLPLQEPGQYNIEVLNSGDGFTVEGDVVTIEDDAENPEFIASNPAYLYTGRTSVTAVKDRNTIIKVPLTIQMKKLVVRVYFKNDPTIYTNDNPSGFKRPVKAVRASMTGVAKKMDFIEGTYMESRKVDLPFVVRNTLAQGRFLECSLVLLGVFGDDQVMNLEVDFDYGEDLRPEDFSFKQQLTELAFNDDKSEADTVNTQIRMVLTAGGEATIEPYEPGNGENGEDIEVGEDEVEYAIGDLYPKHDPTRPTGVVVWLTPDNKHGIVLGGKGSDELPEGSEEESERGLVNWGQVAEIDASRYTMGIRNTAGVLKFIADKGYSQAFFGAYDWLVEAYQNDPSWFIPSKAEWELIHALSDEQIGAINDKLTDNGFLPLDLTATYWSSQTKRGDVKPEEDWQVSGVPDYWPSTVYTWSKASGEEGGIEETYVTEELNADHEDPAEGETPVLGKVRAMRFF